MEISIADFADLGYYTRVTRYLRRTRLAALGTAAIALALVAVAVDAAEGERDLAARDLVRLSDLGPGYNVGDDSGCAIGPTDEGASPRLRRFNHKHRRYRGCETDFLELWRPPDIRSRPTVINSVAIRFAGPAEARAAFRIGPDFAVYNLDVSRRSVKRVSANPRVGTESRMYRTNDALVEDVPGRPAVIVIWRTGGTLSMVLRSGEADAAGREDALRLAEIQQQRVLRPTPVPAGANDDRFVSLNNPAIDVPIRWLGLNFRAPGLPRLAFADGEATSGNGPGPGNTAHIEYAAPVRKNPYSGVTLDIWRPATWTRFVKSRTGRLIWTARCTKATRVALPTGYAVLFAGHTKHQTRCGRRPNRFLAHVYLPDSVVSVNVPTCAACISRGRGPDPWNSLRGMRAIATGLTVRPRE